MTLLNSFTTMIDRVDFGLAVELDHFAAISRGFLDVRLVHYADIFARKRHNYAFESNRALSGQLLQSADRRRYARQGSV